MHAARGALKLGTSLVFLAIGTLLVAFVYMVKINITTYNGATQALEPLF